MMKAKHKRQMRTASDFECEPPALYMEMIPSWITARKPIEGEMKVTVTRNGEKTSLVLPTFASMNKLRVALRWYYAQDNVPAHVVGKDKNFLILD